MVEPSPSAQRSVAAAIMNFGLNTSTHAGTRNIAAAAFNTSMMNSSFAASAWKRNSETNTHMMIPMSPLRKTQLLWFLAPCMLSLLLFMVLNISCQSAKAPPSGEITFFFTADTGGRLDPCG